MSYKSPIEIEDSTFYEDITSQIAKEAGQKIDDLIYNAITKFEVFVDKEELAKALAYDRQQYEKGYEDGIKARTRYARWEEHPFADIFLCSRCGYEVPSEELKSRYCPNCGAKMDEQVENTDKLYEVI